MISRKRLFDWIALFFATTAFSGFLPGWVLKKQGKYGGTAGAMVALIPLYVLLWFHVTAWAAFFLSCLSFCVGMLCVERGERFLLQRGGKRMRHVGKDPVSEDFNETCIDEFHGQCLAAIPAFLCNGTFTQRALVLFVTFILFRIFDAKKPPPIRQVEQHFYGSAFGIMIDDTVAAIFAAAITYGLMLL